MVQSQSQTQSHTGLGLGRPPIVGAKTFSPGKKDLTAFFIARTVYSAPYVCCIRICICTCTKSTFFTFRESNLTNSTCLLFSYLYLYLYKIDNLHFPWKQWCLQCSGCLKGYVFDAWWRRCWFAVFWRFICLGELFQNLQMPSLFEGFVVQLDIYYQKERSDAFFICIQICFCVCVCNCICKSWTIGCAVAYSTAGAACGFFTSSTFQAGAHGKATYLYFLEHS